MGARSRYLSASCLLIGLVLAFTVSSGVARGQSQDVSAGRCPVKNAQVKTGGEAVEPPVKLLPDPNSQSRVINFDTNREPKFATFSVASEPALPAELESRLNRVADTIVRVGNDKTETVLFPEPTFSNLRVSGNRKRITFDVCLDPPSDISAGRYAGVITLDGPPGVESAAVTVTANAKNGLLFKIGLGVTAVLAAFILFYKEAARKRAAAIQAAGNDGSKKEEAEKWTQHLRAAFTLGWAVGTLFAVGAMVGVLIALWDGNPSWGDAGLAGSLAALVGAGMAAIGAKEIFSSVSS
jgi:hypothetical protein